MLLTKGVDHAMLLTQYKYSVLLSSSFERMWLAAGAAEDPFPD